MRGGSATLVQTGRKRRTLARVLADADQMLFGIGLEAWHRDVEQLRLEGDPSGVLHVQMNRPGRLKFEMLPA